jgi:hypothetical protein
VHHQHDRTPMLVIEPAVAAMVVPLVGRLVLHAHQSGSVARKPWPKCRPWIMLIIGVNKLALYGCLREGRYDPNPPSCHDSHH